jgi:protein phosphatase
MEASKADTVELPTLGPGGEVGPPRAVTAAVRFELGALSHQGNVRPNNEDHFLVASLERAFQTLRTSLPEGLVPARFLEVGYGLLVADGMGGSAAGEKASQVAITSLVNLLLHSPEWIMRGGPRQIEEMMRRFAERFGQINNILSECAQQDPRLAGMGTTMTLAASLGPDLVLVHIGDSRAYLLRDGELHRLTRDHTMAQALVDMGVLRPEEAETHSRRHVLTRALSASGAWAEPDVEWVPLQDGDQVLLCTDGLTGMVEDAAIGEVLRSAATADEACRELVDRALANGGLDNVTVVLGRYGIPQGGQTSASP